MPKNTSVLAEGNNELVVNGFNLHKSGLTPIGTPTFTDWQECGIFIQEAEKSVQFWIGDWLNYGETTWGKKYEEALEKTGLDYQTLRNYKWVASSVPLSLRRDNLSYHHHKEVANLEPEKQAYLLDKAVALSWPLLKLKQEK